jgi:hypothetical protein
MVLKLDASGSRSETAVKFVNLVLEEDGRRLDSYTDSGTYSTDAPRP